MKLDPPINSRSLSRSSTRPSAISPAMPRKCAVHVRRPPPSSADLVVFPELFIAGYPPEDLVLKPAFQAACRAAIEALARETASAGPALLVGTPWVEDGKLYNAVACSMAALSRRALQGRFAELRRVRRKARVRAGADARPGQFPGRAAGVADLRGYLGRGNGRMPGRNRRRNSGGAERLAILAAEGRRAT